MQAATPIKAAAAIAMSMLCLAAFSNNLQPHAAVHDAAVLPAAALPLQTITVTARRPVPTIVVSAKRLSGEEKAAAE